MIALASDHVGLDLKRIIMEELDAMGQSYVDFGTDTDARCNYPEYAFRAAEAVRKGECSKGIIFCGTGIGMSIAANKVKGIRCVVCSEPYSAQLSRRHNDTNMLALGSRVVGAELAKMIVKAWLEGEYEGGRHAIRIDQIRQIEENGNLKT